MAIALTNASKKGKKLRRGQIPSKRSINLAFHGEKKVNMLIAVPGIILIVVLAALFSKFFVIDRMAEVSAARSNVNQLQTRLNAAYEELADYDDISELYAHYTYSGMTEEELQRTDRTEILDVMRRVVLPSATVDSMSLSGNVMTVSLTGTSLQQINLLAQALGEEEIVDFCTVTSAVNNTVKPTPAPTGGETGDGTAEETTDAEVVSARLIIYFKPEGETQG